MRKYDPRRGDGPWRILAGRHSVVSEAEVRGVSKRIDLEFMFGEILRSGLMLL